MFAYTGTYALRLLRAIRCGYLAHALDDLPREDLCTPPTCGYLPELHEFGEAAAPAEGERIAIASPAVQRRPRIQGASCELISVDLPEGAFVRAARDVLVAGPELLFVRLARELEFRELVALGCELCGSYSPDPLGASEEGSGCAYQIKPATTPAAIKAFIAAVPSMHGVSRARQAAEYVLSGSASPMETMLALQLSLPVARGGYGLGAPVLNELQDVPASQQALTNMRHFAPDIFYPEYALDVEYESNEAHIFARGMSGIGPKTRREIVAKVNNDKRRMRDIQALGIRVMQVTYDDCLSIESLDRIARQIYQHIAQVRGLRYSNLSRRLGGLSDASYRWSQASMLLPTKRRSR